MTVRYLYRGTDLRAAASNELAELERLGEQQVAYKMTLDPEPPSVDEIDFIPPETTLTELQWQRGIFRGKPVGRTEYSVVGGFTDGIGAALDFASGIPLVIYLDADRITPRLEPIQYTHEWFSDHPGVYSHVQQGIHVAELHDTNVGLFAEVRTRNTPVVRYTPAHSIVDMLENFSREMEYVAYADRVDLSSALRDVTVFLTPRFDARWALAQIPPYRLGDSNNMGVDVTDWPRQRAVGTLAQKAADMLGYGYEDITIVATKTAIASRATVIAPHEVEYVYVDGELTEDPFVAPNYLFGDEYL